MKNEIVHQSNPSERFYKMVVSEFTGSAGMVEFTDFQKKLAQDLFIKADMTLNDLEQKRLSTGKQGTAIAWGNVNLQKLAVDASHRINLGLDALIPNHIHPIPYWNKKNEKYDLDLQIGYVGKDYYRRKMSTMEPVDIVYELVRANDEFIVHKKGMENKVEAYIFNITDPFSRGKVIGGFGYIMFENTELNKLVLVSEEDFLKSRGLAKSKTFWDAHPDKMRMKTLVLRTTDHLIVDPEKVNASYLQIENSENDDSDFDNGNVIDHAIDDEIDQNANQKALDIEPEKTTKPEPEKKSDDSKKNINNKPPNEENYADDGGEPDF